MLGHLAEQGILLQPACDRKS